MFSKKYAGGKWALRRAIPRSVESSCNAEESERVFLEVLNIVVWKSWFRGIKSMKSRFLAASPCAGFCSARDVSTWRAKGIQKPANGGGKFSRGALQYALRKNIAYRKKVVSLLASTPNRKINSTTDKFLSYERDQKSPLHALVGRSCPRCGCRLGPMAQGSALSLVAFGGGC